MNWLTRMKFWGRPEGQVPRMQRVLCGTGDAAGLRPFGYEAAVRQCHSWVYAAAMLNAQGVAAVPLRLYVRRRIGRKLFGSRALPPRRLQYLLGDGPGARHPSHLVCAKMAALGGDLEEVTGHPATTLLRTVNPHLNGYNLTTLRILHQELTGNAYVLVLRDAHLGHPRELWPLPPQDIWLRSTAGQFVDHYLYRPAGGAGRRLEPEEVIHFKYPSPTNMHYGMGKVEAGWGVLNLQRAKREMDTAIFTNMARPDYAVVVRSGASDDQLRRFEAKISERLAGPRNSGRFLGITGDVQLVPLNFPPRELGDGDRVLEEVAAIFGIPRDKLLGNATYANAEHAERAWLKGTILPLVRQDEEKLNEGYLPLWGLEEDAVLAYDDPVPENQRHALARRTQLVAAGILTVDEARAEEGLPPLGG